MFRRKQNQIVKLISTKSLDVTSEGQCDIREKNSAATERPGDRSSKVKKPIARRSKSLEGNLDLIDHVTVSKEDKGKPQHSSQPHGLDEDTNSGQSSSHGQSSHFSGRRMQVLSTPPTSTPTQEQTSARVQAASDTHPDTIKTPQEQHMKPVASDLSSSQPKSSSQNIASTTGHNETLATDRGSVVQVKLSLPPTKTNYPTDPANDPFRDRTDTANSIKFDISYDL